VRGVEHGEAQDVGRVLHNAIQMQNGEVLEPRIDGEVWGQLLSGTDMVGRHGTGVNTHHGGKDVLVKC
jgi:hypothetical protein